LTLPLASNTAYCATAHTRDMSHTTYDLFTCELESTCDL